MKSRRPNQPRVIRSAVAKKKKKKNCHVTARLASLASRRQPLCGLILISHRPSSPPAVFLPRETQRTEIVGRRTGTHANMHACMHACMGCMRRGTMHAASRQKGTGDFPMQIAKVARTAKITVGNNAVDWEVELARASRETDNISLGRPLRRTIK